jgi:hypothetical protein
LVTVSGAGKAQAPVGQSSGAPVIANGSFEDLDGANPRGWKTATFRRAASFAVGEAGHTGRRSVQVVSLEGADAAWTTVALVRPYAKYRLSGWIKTENVDAGTGKGALLTSTASRSCTRRR